MTDNTMVKRKRTKG